MKLNIERILIAIFIILLSGMIYGYKISKNKLKIVEAKNKTLQEAIKNPRIIEKPVIKYRDVIVTKKVPVKTEGEGGDYLVDVIEVIREVEIMGGRIIEPFVPVIPTSETKRKNWSFLGGYNLTNRYGSLGGGRRIYKSIRIYGEYYFDKSIGVKVSVNF